MLTFDRSTIKHGTQNIQNDCHQWLSESIIVHQILFGQGSAQESAGELYSAPWLVLRGCTSKEEEKKERGKRRVRGEKRKKDRG